MQISVTFAVYFLLIMTIAAYAFRATRNHADYILGGRSLGGVVTAMGAGASDMSSWLMLGLPGAVYAAGLGEIWMPIGLLVGAYFNWTLVAKRLRIYTEVANDSLTIPAYLENRFQDKSHSLRIALAFIILVFFTIYAAAGFVGGALLFSTAFEWSYFTSLLVVAAFILAYTAVGGFLAVNWVDLFQGGLMLLALLIVPTMVLYQLDGWQTTVAIVESINISYTNLSAGIGAVTIISLLAWGLGYFGQPHILVRFMAAKKPESIKLARRVCMSWMCLCLLGAVLVGFAGIAYYADSPLLRPEQVFLHLSKSLFNVWVTGILFAAVLSAILSTIAAQLLASSSALAEDVYRAYFRKKASQRELVWVGRCCVALITLLAMVLALDPEASVLMLVSYAWAGLGITLGPVILVSLFWRDMTTLGALIGMLMGLSFALLFYFLNRFVPEHMWYEIYDIYPIIPGFIACLLGIFLGSRLRKKPSEKIYQDFAEYQRRLR